MAETLLEKSCNKSSSSLSLLRSFLSATILTNFFFLIFFSKLLFSKFVLVSKIKVLSWKGNWESCVLLSSTSPAESLTQKRLVSKCVFLVWGSALLTNWVECQQNSADSCDVVSEKLKFLEFKIQKWCEERINYYVENLITRLKFTNTFNY